jgi:hypothetical protein
MTENVLRGSITRWWLRWDYWVQCLSFHSSWTPSHYETGSVTFLKGHKNYKLNWKQLLLGLRKLTPIGFKIKLTAFRKYQVYSIFWGIIIKQIWQFRVNWMRILEVRSKTVSELLQCKRNTIFTLQYSSLLHKGSQINVWGSGSG